MFCDGMRCSVRCQGRYSGQCTLGHPNQYDLMNKLQFPVMQVCHDHSNLYRKADIFEVELGHCNKTVNPLWTPDLTPPEIEAVEWYYCKKSQMCIDIYTR